MLIHCRHQDDYIGKHYHHHHHRRQRSTLPYPFADSSHTFDTFGQNSLSCSSSSSSSSSLLSNEMFKKTTKMYSTNSQSSSSLSSTLSSLTSSLGLITYLGISCWCLLSSLLLLVQVTDAVHINSISRPQSYRYGTANSIILDCDFTIENNDDLLVVKWFLNDDPQHIYQWIQSRDVRIYSDKIKPFVDEKFIVKDYQTRHRALRLLNPPASLSGKYTCSVSSLQNEEINSTYLVIYEPAKAFNMDVIEDENQDDDDDNDGFNITCTAIGLYPEPEIKLYKVRSINETFESEEVKSNSTTVISFRSMTNGFYSITLVSHIDQINNQTQTNPNEEDQPQHSSSMANIPAHRARLAASKKVSPSNNIAEHYECRLSIPNTDYIEVRRLAIQDGWRTKWRSNGSQNQNGMSFTLVAMMAILSFWTSFMVPFTYRTL